MAGFLSGSAQANKLITPSDDVNKTAGSAQGGSGGGGGGGGGGGSSAADEKEQFYQVYRAVCQVLGIPLNAKVAAMAYKNRQPGSGFLSLVKKFDKNYLKTGDFKNNAAQFVAKWNEMLPGRRVDYKDMAKFVRGDWSNDRMDQFIMKTKAFKKAYPFFRPGDHDPVQYRQYDRAATRILNGPGMPVTRAQKRMFFDYDMTPQELEANVEAFIGGSQALDLMFGGQQKTGNARMNDYIFAKPGNLARRALLKQAVETQAGFNQSDIASATVMRDESTRRIKQTGI